VKFNVGDDKNNAQSSIAIMTTHLRMFCKDKEGIMRSTRRKRSRASNKQALMTKGSAAIWLARGSARRKPLSAGYGLGGSSVSSFPQTPGKGPRRPISTSLSLEHLSLLNITQRTGHSKHSAQRTAHSPQRTAHSTHTQRIAHSAQRTAHSAQRTAHSALLLPKYCCGRTARLIRPPVLDHKFPIFI
jgi:hypothetical protein